MDTIGLVWIYCGSDVDRRMSTVDGMFAGTRVDVRLVSGATEDGVRRRLSSGPTRIVQSESAELTAVVTTFPEDTRVVVFWRDDDKAVVSTFPEQLAVPLIEGHRDIHYWDRNALAVVWDRQDSLLEGLDRPVDLAAETLLDLMSAMIGHRAMTSGRRLGIALASESRFVGTSTGSMDRAS